MFAQYNLSDKSQETIQATTSAAVDVAALASAGRGQVEIPDNTNILMFMLDTTQDPPVLFPLVT